MTGAYDLPNDTPGFADAQAEMARLSEPLAGFPGARLNLAYGPDPRHKLDVFPAHPASAAILFLRGGYWRVGDKEPRRFPAREWHARGVTWIVPNTRLAPAVSLADILADAEAALRFVVRNAATLGVDPGRIHVCGNSAGAHLAAMLAAGPSAADIRSLTLLSGLYDLSPLLAEAPNAWLTLTETSARALSPVHHLPDPGLPVSVAVGATETGSFLHQSRAYADALRANGTSVDFIESAGKNHMQIILECGRPGTPVFGALKRHLGLT